jgi:branched-chain amino acid transport system substrate-binding protein
VTPRWLEPRPPGAAAAPLALAALSALLGAACSLTTYGSDDCRDNAQCKATFGAGYTCGGDGLCAPPAPPPRCGRAFPIDVFTRPAEYRDAILIGLVMDASDPADRAAANAVELAVNQVNESGRLGGREVAVVMCTNQADARLDRLDAVAAAAEAGRYLARDVGVPVIVGGSTSAQAEALYRAVAPFGTLVISHSATSPALTPLDAADGLFWRTAPPDSVQGAAIAADMQRRGSARVAAVVESGPYGDGLAEVFRSAFSGTVMRFGYASGNATERNSATMRVSTMASSFDEVLLITSDFADPGAFLDFASTFPAFASMPIFMTDTAAAAPDFVSAGGARSALFGRLRGTRPRLGSGPAYMSFVGSYTARYPDDGGILGYQYAPHAYDAAWLAFCGAAAALGRDGTVTGAGIAAGLRRVSARGAATQFDLLPEDWRMLQSELSAGRDVDVRGASGELDYDPVTEETSGVVEYWRVDTAAAPPIVPDGVYTPPP